LLDKLLLWDYNSAVTERDIRISASEIGAVSAANKNLASESRPSLPLPQIPIRARIAAVFLTVGGVALLNNACNNQEDADSTTPTPRETATATIEPTPTQEPENPFGFTIPEDVKTLEEALLFIRNQQELKAAPLIDNEEVFIGTQDNSENPQKLLVYIKKPKTAEEYRVKQKEWAQKLQNLLDRWDICNPPDLIAWHPTTIKEDSTDPFGDIGLDPEKDSKTPSCAQNVK